MQQQQQRQQQQQQQHTHTHTHTPQDLYPIISSTLNIESTEVIF